MSEFDDIRSFCSGIVPHWRRELSESIVNKKRLNIFGDIFFDVMAEMSSSTLPRWGTDTLADCVRMLPGGGALNTCCHASRRISGDGGDTGVDISLFSMVGEDSQADICTKKLVNIGVSVNDVLAMGGRHTGTCMVISGKDKKTCFSDRCFLTDRGCIDDLCIEAFDRERLLNCTHFHLAGYYNITKVMKDPSGLIDLFTEMQERGITISLNPQFDSSECWDSMGVLAPYIDVFIANEGEVEAIYNTIIRDPEVVKIDTLIHSKMISKNEEDILPIHRKTALFLALGMGNVVVTMGAQGAFMHSAIQRIPNTATAECSEGFCVLKSIIHSEPAIVLPSPIVDATGAGDAFSGGFLVDWVAHKSHDLVASLGNSLIGALCAGAGAVTVFGGSNTD